MRCFFTFALAAALTVGLSATTWSQTGGGAAAGGATGGAGSSGVGSNTAGTSGVGNNTQGTSGVGSNNTPGTTGVGNNTPGTSGVGNNTPGTSGVGNNSPGTNGVGNNTPGTSGVSGAAGTRGNTGVSNGVGSNGVRNRNENGVNGRANANAARRNGAAGAGVNGNVNGNYYGVNQTPFFTDPGARRQLNLNDNQYNSLTQAYQNAYTRYNQGLNKLNDPNLSEQQREQQMQQLETQFNQNFSGSLNSTFNNPQGLSRYNQLNRQYQGFNAFNDPSVRKQLNLSQDQIRQLRTLSNNWRQQMQQFQRGNGNSQSSVDPGQWAQMQQQYATQLNGVLTPEQQQKWSQQTGQPYSFSPDVYFGNRQSGNVSVENPPAADPNVPKYFPNKGAGATTPQGTQPQPGPRQPTTQAGARQPASQGSASGGTASQGGGQGTVR